MRYRLLLFCPRYYSVVVQFTVDLIYCCGCRQQFINSLDIYLVFLRVLSVYRVKNVFIKSSIKVAVFKHAELFKPDIPLLNALCCEIELQLQFMNESVFALSIKCQLHIDLFSHKFLYAARKSSVRVSIGIFVNVI